MIYLSLTHYFYLILLQFGSLHFISLRLTRTQTGGHFLIVYCLLALELKFRLNNRRDFGFPLIRKGYSTSINFASKKRYLLLFSRRPSPVVRGAWYQRTIENEKSNSDNKKTHTRLSDEHTKQVSSFVQSFVRSRYPTLPAIPRRISFLRFFSAGSCPVSLYISTMTSSPSLYSDLPGHSNRHLTSPLRNNHHHHHQNPNNHHHQQHQQQQPQQFQSNTPHSASETRHDRNIASEQGLYHTERSRHAGQAAEAKPAAMTANAQGQAHALAHSNAYACQAAPAAQHQQHQQQQQTSETASLINEFGLVAEAVKRAEIAIMMRDMEGVELAWNIGILRSWGFWAVGPAYKKKEELGVAGDQGVFCFFHGIVMDSIRTIISKICSYF